MGARGRQGVRYELPDWHGVDEPCFLLCESCSPGGEHLCCRRSAFLRPTAVHGAGENSPWRADQRLSWAGASADFCVLGV